MSRLSGQSFGLNRPAIAIAIGICFVCSFITRRNLKIWAHKRDTWLWFTVCDTTHFRVTVPFYLHLKLLTVHSCILLLDDNCCFSSELFLPAFKTADGIRADCILVTVVAVVRMLFRSFDVTLVRVFTLVPVARVSRQALAFERAWMRFF